MNTAEKDKRVNVTQTDSTLIRSIDIQKWSHRV
jgi:hypothetical protein